eukprot:CAMPEP_0174878270 /NCGR_PEP_ID=MMETSP1114-20130205/82674_1 /TAXON_ID=312471 /ORGANISM="Neobodo designis, Strain CCAP 1951/1" /LENGTH=169 /DNA_ID=CAMNT_0016113657 /DNA_START=263 /DNA_END=773 /DNA_ORIENTATION=-
MPCKLAARRRGIGARRPTFGVKGAKIPAPPSTAVGAAQFVEAFVEFGARVRRGAAQGFHHLHRGVDAPERQRLERLVPRAVRVARLGRAHEVEPLVVFAVAVGSGAARFVGVDDERLNARDERWVLRAGKAHDVDDAVRATVAASRHARRFASATLSASCCWPDAPVAV